MASNITRTGDLIIPDVYSEDVVANVMWLQEKLSFSDEYVTDLIRVSKELFSKWKKGEATLTGSQLKTLENLWSAMNRLLSYFNFRRDLMMRVLEARFSDQIHRTKSTPPWVGTSLRDFMLLQGRPGIYEVECWVWHIRSANSD